MSSNSEPEKACSSSASPDNYLAEVVNMDSSTYPFSANLTPKSSDDIPITMNASTDKECVIDTKVDSKTDSMDVSSLQLISDQADGEHKVKTSPNAKPVDDDTARDCAVPSEVCSKVDPHSSADPALTSQCSAHSTDEKAGYGHAVEVGSNSPENVQEAEKCGENIENKLHKDHIPEAGECQQDSRRHSLQFEDGQQKIIANNIDKPAGPEDVKIIEPSPLDKPATTSSGLVGNMGSPSFSPQDSKSCITKVPRPSGIGLHLNSIVSSLQMGSGTNISVKSGERSSSLTILGKKSVSKISCHSSVTSQMENVSMSSEDCRHHSYASLAANSFTNFSANSTRSLNKSLPVNPIEQIRSMCEKRKSDSENADIVEDFSSSSPKKRRKKALDSGDSIGCKRCNCKKSKCLKLYCDCFTAGIYCAEPCTCQGCFNRPEYEDTVLETRQQIESRNPLAFAPKIIQNLNKSPASSSVDNVTHSTPASSRHKRGCNCKKSKCLKKYCECYQANVGCSDGCRCEGCHNVYGRKEEYGTVRDLITKQSTNELLNSFDAKLEQVASQDGSLQNELCNNQSLTPPTPSFQFSNHGKGDSKSWFHSERYLPSPEAGFPLMTQYVMSSRPAINPDTHRMILDGDNDIMDLVPLAQELDYGSADVLNQFSPRFGGLKFMGNPTAFPNPQNFVDATEPRVFPGNPNVPSACSLRWRSSPTTPMTHLGETKFLEVVNFGSGNNVTDDDTPEILQETPPPNAVKVSSPNKKRVSPPHGGSSEQRTGRKYILQSVPPFPPLTPCIDSKVVAAGQGIDDSQKCSSSKH